MKMLSALWAKLNGKKTYIVAAVTVIYAVSGVAIGMMSWDTAIGIILGALGLGALRNAVQ